MAELQIVPAAVMKNVEAQYVEMRVPLYSYGCERKIKKALANLRGIYSVDVNFNEQKVTVWGICNKYDLLDTIRSKRKGAHFWNSEDDDNLVLGSLEETSADHAEVSSSSSSLSSVNCRRKGKGIALPPLTLIRCRSSLNWKAWKKVFIRSYSF